DLAHLPRRLSAIGRWSARPVLLLVGDGYSPAEVTRELGVSPLGRVPHDPRGAAVLCGRPNMLRWGRGRPARSPLGQLAHKLATVLVAQDEPPSALPQHTAVPPRPGSDVRAAGGVPEGPGAVNGVRSAVPPGHSTIPDTGRPGAVS